MPGLLLWGWIWEIGGHYRCSLHVSIHMHTGYFHQYPSCPIRDLFLWALLLLCQMPTLVCAESPAPSVHWRALIYPDRERRLDAGLTINRFTEFDGTGRRYNDIDESAGFNFATLSWTERLSRFEGWNTNLTAGAGPTAPQPSRFLQNDFAHKLIGEDPVPVGNSRTETDFMISGSLTKWGTVFGQREVSFAGIGFSSGSLYHEANLQVGLRRLSLAEMVKSWTGHAPAILGMFSRFVRFSGAGRYGRLYGGGAYPTVAPQSYRGQFSISLPDYRNEDPTEPPRWELEVSYTIDSDLFVNRNGNSIEEQLGSITIRFPYGAFEFWNDTIGRTDFGPTAGGRPMIDLLRLYARLSK